ncbi:MAG: hypothetical protein ACTSUO_00845 [Candidatus Thorarchaeota archaeon]
MYKIAFAPNVKCKGSISVFTKQTVNAIENVAKSNKKARIQFLAETKRYEYEIEIRYDPHVKKGKPRFVLFATVRLKRLKITACKCVLIPKIGYQKYVINGTPIEVRLSPEDNFDFEIGCALAIRRYLKQRKLPNLGDLSVQFLAKYNNWLTNVVNKFWETINKVEKKYKVKVKGAVLEVSKNEVSKVR